MGQCLSLKVKDKSSMEGPQRGRTDFGEIEAVQMDSFSEKALGIYLVVKNTIKFLSTSDLKKSRLVNKAWKEAADEELLKRDSLEICMKYSKVLGEFVQYSNKRLRREYSTVLNDDLIESTCLPCSTLTLCGGNLGTYAMKCFLRNFGPNIKTLTLTCNQNEQSPTSKQTFCHILTQLAPNIQKFQIVNDFEFDYNWNYSPELQLVKLKCFVLPNLTPDDDDVAVSTTTTGILKAGTNLESLENVSMIHLNSIIKVGKMHLIKEIVDFGGAFSLKADFYNKFSNVKLSLRKLIATFAFIYEDPKAVSDAFINILTSSQSSLQELRISQCCSSPGFPIKVPCLENLRRFDLCQCCSRSRQNNVKLSWDFPKLEELSVRSDMWDSLLSPLPPKGCLSAVRTLEISYIILGNDLDTLRDMCPGIQLLKLKKGTNQDILLRKVFDFWPQLKSLEITVEVGRNTSKLVNINRQMITEYPPNCTLRELCK